MGKETISWNGCGWMHFQLLGKAEQELQYSTVLSCKEISVLQRWIEALEGNEEAMRYLGIILQILLGFKQAPALHSGHVLHVSSQNLQLNLCSVTFSITLLQQRLLLFFPVPSWPVLKVSSAISLGWHTENSDISTFTRGATTWIDENLALGFSIWKEVSTKQRKVPILHSVNESPLSMCIHNSVLCGMPLLGKKRWTKLKLLTNLFIFFLTWKLMSLNSEGMKLIGLSCMLLGLEGKIWNESQQFAFSWRVNTMFFSELLRVLQIMNCPSFATFLGAQNKWGWMRPQEVSNPTLGSEPRALTSSPCTSLHSIFFFLTKRRNFLPLLYIIHNFWVPSCPFGVPGHLLPSSHWTQTILAATDGHTKILLRQRCGTGVTPPSPGGQSLIQEVPLRENLQVTIPRTNQLPCSGGQKL